MKEQAGDPPLLARTIIPVALICKGLHASKGTLLTTVPTIEESKCLFPKEANVCGRISSEGDRITRHSQYKNTRINNPNRILIQQKKTELSKTRHFENKQSATILYSYFYFYDDDDGCYDYGDYGDVKSVFDDESEILI